MGNTDKKIFDELDEVNCNDCQHYWDNSCDGVALFSKRKCVSYTASRKTDIPKRLTNCENRLNWAFGLIFGLTTWMFLHLITLH